MPRKRSATSSSAESSSPGAYHSRRARWWSHSANASARRSASAVYRATITLRNGGPAGPLLSDYVFLGDGRVEYEFTVVAPLAAADQLTRFELGLAQILLRRAAAPPA